MKMIIKFFERLQNFIHVIVSLALAIMMCIIFLQTFTRFVIFYSLPWSEELSRYLFVLIILWGLNLAVRDDMLIKIDVVDNMINGKLQNFLNVSRLAVALIASATLTYSCINIFPVVKGQVSPAMQIPIVYMYYIVFIGFALTTLSILVKIIENINDSFFDNIDREQGGI